jgi:hypothetical protein
MNTKPLFSRLRPCLIGIGALTFLALLLRTLALFLAFDAEIGYLATGAAARRSLVYLLYVTEIFGAVAVFAPLFSVRRDELPTDRAPLSKVGSVGAGLCAFLFAAAAVFLLTKVSSLPCPALLTVLAAICLAVGAAYFVLHFLDKTDKAPACGFGVIFASALLLSITYFDRYTPMNAPHKVALHLCLLSVMLFMLYELRALIGRPMPRALLVTSAICFFLCAAIGVSDLIAFAARIYTDPLYFVIDLLVTGLALYVGSRAVGDLIQASPDAAVEPASDGTAA